MSADAPAFLYRGRVMHARLRPFQHRFDYAVWSLLLDLDRIEEAVASAPLLRRNRFGLVGFHDRDHGPRDGSALRPHVDRLLARAGLPRPARVRLLCHPRVLGYAFNPLAIYFCEDERGALEALVYEVRNTFGEHHSYVCPVAPGEASAAGVRQARDKLFFVSPFLELDLRYRFRVAPPDERLRLRILVDRAGAPVLATAYTAEREPLTDAALLRACRAVPLLGLKIMAAIHWEALRVWLKGARLVARPAPPPPASFAPVRPEIADRPS
jgi:DUF1365 family protein